jgi:DNA-binding NarL/FixJ family response regulator|tara:strand:+ start:101 stop:772 length:672 start_codon:yes stop_codon:yes gene_type:complete
MKMIVFGTPKGIKDLNLPSLKLNKIERNQIPILVIDDEDFEYLKHVKNHRFDIEYFNDIQTIESAEAYEIILCDIQGVGKKFKSKYQGAHVIQELRKKYPFKTIIAYTGYTHDPTFNRFFAMADFSVKKDIDGDEWIDKLDEAISIATDPKRKWIKMRDFLLENDVPLFDILKLEDEFVNAILNKKSIDNFPSSKLSNEISSDVRAVLQSFTASVIFKIIFGI